jgi:hypothetical protein
MILINFFGTLYQRIIAISTYFLVPVATQATRPILDFWEFANQKLWKPLWFIMLPEQWVASMDRWPN